MHSLAMSISYDTRAEDFISHFCVRLRIAGAALNICLFLSEMLTVLYIST
jgi:hypothetical protein